MYPNPASNYINFRITDYPSQLNIFNAQGQLVKRFFLKEESSQINVETFSVGIYFFSILTQKDIRSGKIIIER